MELLPASQLVKLLKKEGVKFEIISARDAIYSMSHINHCYKLMTYGDNFPKDANHRYQNLDFAYLTDLAAVDLQLRDYLLSLALDVEHGVKVMLINYLANDTSENGYTIVEEFAANFPSQYKMLLAQFHNNKYKQASFRKYQDKLPVWELMENSSYGVLSQFLDFYYQKTQYKRLRRLYHSLKFCKNIRNACAHSNPFLVTLFSNNDVLDKPSVPIVTAAQQMGIPRKYLRDLKIHDLVATFSLHKFLQSPKMQGHRYRQGKRVLIRFHRHAAWYAGNQKLTTFFDLLEKMIDYLER